MSGVISRLKQFSEASEVGLNFLNKTFVSPVARELIRPFVSAESVVSGRKGGVDTPFGRVKPLFELSSGEALGGAAELLLSGPVKVGKLFKPAVEPATSLAKGAGRAVQESAETTFKKGLAPTTKKLKAVTERITPEALERGIKGTQKQIVERAKSGIQSASDKFEELGELKGFTPTSKVLDAFDDIKSGFIVDGVPINKRGIAIVDEIADTVRELGDNVPSESLRAVRRIWDKEVAQAGGFVGKTLKEGTEVSVKEMGASVIRKELAKQFPDFAKVNKEYTFFKRLEEVALATQLRRVGQTGALRKGLGAITGATIGSKLGPYGSAVFALAGEKLAALSRTTLVKTLSASAKKSIADALLSDKINPIKVADWLAGASRSTLKVSDFNKFLKEEAHSSKEEIEKLNNERAERIQEISDRINSLRGEETSEDRIKSIQERVRELDALR